jgi:predicted metal-binding protein
MGGGTKMASAQTAVASCGGECDRLWKECNEALEEYLNVLAERNAARKRLDHDLVEAFEDIENDSLEKCQNARKAIFEHENPHILDQVGKDCQADSPEEVLATELLAQ